jgi:hypothetical protein
MSQPDMGPGTWCPIRFQVNGGQLDENYRPVYRQEYWDLSAQYCGPPATCFKAVDCGSCVQLQVAVQCALRPDELALWLCAGCANELEHARNFVPSERIWFVKVYHEGYCQSPHCIGHRSGEGQKYSIVLQLVVGRRERLKGGP